MKFFPITRQRLNTLLYYILCISLLLFASACGDTDHSSSGTGSISFSVEWHGAPTIKGAAGSIVTRALDCVASGVATVEAEIYDENNNHLVSGGPWNCSEHAGTIENVPEGSNRKAVILGKDSSGDIIYQGEQTGIVVYTGQTTNAGTITVSATSTISAPTGVNATAGDGQVTISWNSVSGATSYNIYWATWSGVSKTNYEDTTNLGSSINPDTTIFESVLSYNGHTYAVTKDYMLTWEEAKTLSNQHGSYLVTINDAQENSFLTQNYLSFLSELWIGYNDKDNEGTWVWTNGETSIYTNWATSEPNDVNGEDCGQIYSSGLWNDLPCINTTYAIVEWEPVAATSYTHTGLTNGTTYYYVVTATNDYGESGESSEVSATPTASAILDSVVFDEAIYYGGSGEEKGTGIAIANGKLYVSGNGYFQQDSSADAIVASYAIPPAASPVWSKNFNFGTNFFGIAATSDGVYTGGWSYSLTTDNSGGKEVKSILAEFLPDGTPGGGTGDAVWLATPNFFSYSGVEFIEAVTTAEESGNTYIYAVGFGQPCSYGGYIISKYDDSGNLVASATDSTVGLDFNTCYYPAGRGSSGHSVTSLNGYVYAAGETGESDVYCTTVWKHDPNLDLIWRMRDASVEGKLHGITAAGSSIYAAGYSQEGPNGGNDVLIVKYDEAGNILWKNTWGGSADDIGYGITVNGNRMYVVGETSSFGSGAKDSFLLQVDTADGTVLDTHYWGGTGDDIGNDVAMTGSDIYVVGQTASYGAGGNDLMILRYNLTSSFTNSLDMAFKLIPAGTFTMGSPLDELGRDSYETQHQVTLSQPFYMHTTEVTQPQWVSVMGSNPSYNSTCSDCPVELVSWNDVQTFITELNTWGEGTYRLPTEAEWEYAARAGTTTALANGDITVTDCSYDPNLNVMGWYCYNSSSTQSVAQKNPNAWGLYDMHGNVWEWCQDWFGTYPSDSVTDPTGPISGSTRVPRGGSYSSDAWYCRSAFRGGYDPIDRYRHLGFRLVRNP